MNVELNILALLKNNSLSFEELLKTGSFTSERELRFALRRLVRAGCVREHLDVYFICDNGIKLLGMARRKRLKHRL